MIIPFSNKLPCKTPSFATLWFEPLPTLPTLFKLYTLTSTCTLPMLSLATSPTGLCSRHAPKHTSLPKHLANVMSLLLFPKGEKFIALFSNRRLIKTALFRTLCSICTLNVGWSMLHNTCSMKSTTKVWFLEISWYQHMIVSMILNRLITFMNRGHTRMLFHGTNWLEDTSG